MDYVRAYLLPSAADEGEEWHAPLQAAVEMYFEKVQNELRQNTSMQVRWTIAHAARESDGPAWTLKALQQPATRKKYAITMSTLIAMVMRRIDTDNFATFPEIPATLMAAAWPLLDCLRAEASASELQHGIHEFLRALWSWTPTREDDEIGDSASPVYMFFALQCLRSGGEFDDPNNVSSRMASLFTWARCWLCQEMTDKRHRYGSAEYYRTHQAADCAFLEDGAPTAYGTLRRTYFLVIRAARESVAHRDTEWIPGSGFQSLAVDGVVVHLEGLRTTYTAALAHAAQIYSTVFLGFTSTCKVGELPQDDWSSRTAGLGVVTSRNTALASRRVDLFNHITQTPSLHAQWFSARSVSNLRDDAPLKWMAAAHKLEEALFFLIHLTSGLPARATELATYKYVNTRFDQRSVFCGMGTLCLVSRYWKGRSITSQDHPAPRFLPRPVAQLLLDYLVYVRPLEVMLSQRRGEARAVMLSTYLFTSRVGEADDTHLRAVWLRLYGQFNSGQQLTLGAFRHVCHALMTKLVMDDPEVARKFLPSDLPIDLQGGHSAKTAATLYGKAVKEDHPALDRETKCVYLVLGDCNSTQPC